MAIIIRHPIKATFIHVPKTGGNSINFWLKTYTECGVTKRNQHAILAEVINGNHVMGPQDKKDLGFVFGVVRNPWDYAVSWYKFRITLLDNKIDYLKQNPNPVGKGAYKLKKFSLEELIEQRKRVLDFEDWLINYKRPPQHNWAKDFDYVFKLENINEDFKFIQEKVGVFEPLPILNKSNRSLGYKNFYTTQQSIDIIADRYYEDIKFYDYNF